MINFLLEWLGSFEPHLRFSKFAIALLNWKNCRYKTCGGNYEYSQQKKMQCGLMGNRDTRASSKSIESYYDLRDDHFELRKSKAA